MAMFQAFDPAVEVNGRTVYTIVDAMGVTRSLALLILRQNGIDDLQPAEWYPQQAWLDAFRDIARQLGGPSLWKIGLKIPENALFPAEIDSLEGALRSIDVAYHMNHRGGEIGHYRVVEISDRSAVMVCNNPYPCDFDRGIIEAMANRFRPEVTGRVRVRHDEAQPCRKNGGESCTYLLGW
jgi:hypothetical protein